MDHEKGRLMTTMWSDEPRYLDLSRENKKPENHLQGTDTVVGPAKIISLGLDTTLPTTQKSVLGEQDGNTDRIRVNKRISQNKI